LGFWLDEDEGFLRVDPNTGFTFSSAFTRSANNLGYSVRVFVLSMNDFVDVAGTDRAIVIGVSTRLGGEAAADAIMERIQSSLACRRVNPPVPIWSIAGWEGSDESTRLRTVVAESTATVFDIYSIAPRIPPG